MSRIFISYRSRDLEQRVSQLHAALVQEFGRDQVTLDRSSFEPGSSWLPQIRNNVAMSDVMLLAMGPAWQERNDPLVLGRLLPAELAWIAGLHFVRMDPANWNADAVSDAVAALGGPERRIGNATVRKPLAAAGEWLLPGVQSVFRSILRPTGAAAAALQPTAASVRRSAALATCSIALLCMVGILFQRVTSLFTVVKLAAMLAISALLVFATFASIAQLAQSPPSVSSMASFSIHCSATLYLWIVAWLFVLWLSIPDPVHQRLLAMTSSALPTAQQMQALEAQLAPGVKWLLAAVQLAAVIHLGSLVTGVAHAGAISLGSKRWGLVLPLSTLGFVSLSAAMVLLTSTEGLRPGNLPMEVRFTWTPDVVDSGC